mgnify:CR=1 FL=1
MNLESKSEYGGYYLNWGKANLIPFNDLVLMNLHYTVFFGEDDERHLNELVKLWWKWMKSPNSKPQKCSKCIREIEILFPIILKQRKNDFIEPESN